MLVRHTTRSSPDAEYPRGRPTGFFDLPLELKEQIYEYCLVNVTPAAYIVYKHAQASAWFFRHMPHRRVPATLLVCKSIRQEVLEVLYRTTDGPSLRINPDFSLHWWTFEDFLFDKADDTQSVLDLAPMLSTVRKVKLELNIPSSFVNQASILAVLRWMVAVLNLRAESGQPPDGVSVELTLECPELWPKENDGFWQVLNSLSCGKRSVVCLLRDDMWLWRKTRIEELCGSRMGSKGQMDERLVDVEMARKALLDSCENKRPPKTSVIKEPQPVFRTWWPGFGVGFIAEAKRAGGQRFFAFQPRVR